jgi:hypothetical protein
MRKGPDIPRYSKERLGRGRMVVGFTNPSLLHPNIGIYECPIFVIEQSLLKPLLLVSKKSLKILRDNRNPYVDEEQTTQDLRRASTKIVRNRLLKKSQNACKNARLV